MTIKKNVRIDFETFENHHFKIAQETIKTQYNTKDKSIEYKEYKKFIILFSLSLLLSIGVCCTVGITSYLYADLRTCIGATIAIIIFFLCCIPLFMAWYMNNNVVYNFKNYLLENNEEGRRIMNWNKVEEEKYENYRRQQQEKKRKEDIENARKILEDNNAEELAKVIDKINNTHHFE